MSRRSSAIVLGGIGSSSGVRKSSSRPAAFFSLGLKPRMPSRIAESFNGKFRDECLSLEWFRSRAEAKVLIEEWRRHFNEVRPHSSLGYLTPNEFVAQGATPAPRHATGRDAAVYGASAPRPVAQPSPQGQMQQAREAVSS